MDDGVGLWTQWRNPSMVRIHPSLPNFKERLIVMVKKAKKAKEVMYIAYEVNNEEIIARGTELENVKRIVNEAVNTSSTDEIGNMEIEIAKVILISNIQVREFKIEWNKGD